MFLEPPQTVDPCRSGQGPGVSGRCADGHDRGSSTSVVAEGLHGGGLASHSTWVRGCAGSGSRAAILLLALMPFICALWDRARKRQS